MKAFILSGGHTIRRCPLTMVRPRPFFPLLRGTLFDALLRELQRSGVTSAVLCSSRPRAAVAPFLNDAVVNSPQVTLHTDALPRGPAGCLRDVARDLDGPSFLVVEGSLFLRGDIATIITHHQQQQAALTIAVVPADQWERTYQEPSTNGQLAPLGLYVASTSVLEHIPAQGFFDIKEQLIPRLRERGLKVVVAPFRGHHHRVRDARSYAALVHDLLAGDLASDHFGELTQTQPQVWVAPGARVAPSATVVGPVLIGRRAIVADQAVVTGPTVICDRALVREKAFVNTSILWPGARVGPAAIVEHSIVTDRFSVPENSRLSHSIAIDHPLALGDLHGLRISGYHVAPIGANHLDATRRLAPAIGSLWKSIKALW